jgi:chemotaxis protein histidine kinase CheA/ActR/RegA family two-component response regulator
VNLDDLMALLAAEYAEGLNPAKRALAARLEPDDAEAVIDEGTSVEAFIDRSIAAARLVNLHGLADFLAHTNEVLALAPSGFEGATCAVWVADALDLSQRYLQAPATPATIEPIVEHAAGSPLATDVEWQGSLASALAAPPQLIEDEDERTQNTFDEVTEGDIALSTDTADPELLAAMMHDAPTQLEKLYRLLDAYGKRSRASEAHPHASLAEAQRVAHTLKGSGNIIGLPGIARLAHRLEDTLIWLDADKPRRPDAEQAAARDATLACETLQQMIGYLAGEDTMPVHALPVLERMQAWAQRIHHEEADEFVPSAVDIGAQETTEQEVAAPILAQSRGDDSSVSLRVSSERIGSLVKRAGQSLVSSQRLAQGLRDIDQRLQTAQDRQQALRVRLDELQRTVERQVVALQARRDEEGEFDPLELDRYDALHLLSRVVAEAVQDQVEITGEVRSEARRLIVDARDEHRELREQHRQLLDARLIAFNSIAPRLRRNVAQTSASLDKQVRLEIEGAETAVDADVLSKLTEPLLHLIRNAIDHGIETPEERLLDGKSMEATVSVRCVREGQQVRIEVADDGRGLDEVAVVTKALRLGLIDENAELATADVHALILQRGFSTKENVSDVSGRGLGLDIVNDRIKAMKGSLSIASFPQIGTSFTMRVPVSSGVVQSIIADVANIRVAISSDQVVTVLPPGSVVSGAENFAFGEESVAIVSLGKWLGFQNDESDFASTAIIVANGVEGKIGLAVDRVHEVRELILQDVGSLLRRIAGVQTGALTDAGAPLFVIDVPELQVRARSGVAMSAALALRQRAAIDRTRVLVVDDALSARRAVQQVFEDRGYEVHVASDGFEALEALRRHSIALIATDLEMPNLNGLELTKRVREIPDWQSVPVIMITSRGGERHRQVALDVGVDEYLVKPFSDRELLQVATQLLEKSSHRSRAAAA